MVEQEGYQMQPLLDDAARERWGRDDSRMALARCCWMLELTADEFDLLFPYDECPQIQSDLREVAKFYQDQFGLKSVREMLGPEKAERLLHPLPGLSEPGLKDQDNA